MSALKTHIARNFVRIYTHPRLRRLRRARAVLWRKITGAPAQVHYFHQADDPYSHLCAQVLARLAGSYKVSLLPHLVSPPQDSAAPDRARLAHWSLRDAGTLALAHGLQPPQALGGDLPGGTAVQAAEAALAAALDAGTFVAQAANISAGLWQPGGQTAPHTSATAARVAECKAQGDALRKRAGHYLGATFYYAGEWYWGLDRLHFLEERLRSEGLCRKPSAPLLAPVHEVTLAPLPGPRAVPGTTLDYFLSFRSPYTYLALPRARALAAHYGAELRLRFVLPMVMRGLPVPVEKRLYIVSDVAREAQRLGMDFGNAVDPVGKPVERGYALLHRAMQEGKGVEFAASFLQGVWADGLDAGSDVGLNAIAARAGFDAAWVQAALPDESWRAVAAANREELLALDLWGVPSFRVNDLPGHWGQDRLWVIEQELRAAQA
jgi:2-hydroxychromene-2-carboxylate isomerase